MVEQIVAALPEGMLSTQDVYASLNFQGSGNAHLSIPDWHTAEFRADPEMHRHEFLTGAEEIAGDMLVFDYCRHDGSMLLQEVATPAEAAELVLGGAGIFNAFTDAVLVFEHFKLCPYRVTYRSRKNDRIVFHKEHLKDERLFPDKQLEWLDVAA